MTIRIRITLVATLVLAVTLGAASVGLVSLVRSQLGDELRDQNRATLQRIVDDLEAGVPPRDLFVPLGSDGTEFVVSRPDGVVVNSSSPNEDLDPDDPVYLVDERRATLPDGRRFLVESLNPSFVVERGVSQVRSALYVFIPLLTLIFALLVWVVVGRALRPVDVVTARARRIRTETLHERLEDPGTNDEIGRLVRTLNSMLERLDRGARAQRQFVSDASHELGSPLTVLLAEAQLAAADPTPERLRVANEATLEHARRLDELVADLLDLARADEGGLRHVEDVDLDEVVRTEAALVRGGTVDLHVVAPVRVRGSRPMLARAVRNLLVNADRHGGERIRVTLAEGADGVLLSVADDGPGIPEGDRERVFERFTRLDAARTVGDGARGRGLGLAIVAAIVAAHQGHVAVHRSDLGGADFVITLPSP